MSENHAIIIFRIEKRNISMDLEIPLDISAHELLLALNEAFGLGLDPADSRHWYLKSERPFALLKGGRALTDFGIRQGSLIKYSL